MSCEKCPPSEQSSSKSNPTEKSLSTRVAQVTSAILPEGTALLSCSCCWLPTVLDFIFAGSVTAVSVERLRPVLLGISLLTLAWSIARDGFTRGNIRRAIICAGLMAWNQYNASIKTGHGAHEGHGGHSCH